MYAYGFLEESSSSDIIFLTFFSHYTKNWKDVYFHLRVIINVLEDYIYFCKIDVIKVRTKNPHYITYDKICWISMVTWKEWRQFILKNFQICPPRIRKEGEPLNS